ncbi:hypothetical protein [Clostridium sardiniense]|uniref:hypothetical protein n=1 Tax=Clostridium sardiniense TaxID=29369 RepID=UPI0019566BA8|nr:hypothetical protein [Clostridium sardiniense]MBM7834919.1 hypothetical protein [Clostridium sardiniense]
MPQNHEKSIIDVKDGNVTDKFSLDKVILTGFKKDSDSNYISNISITVNTEGNGEVIKKDVPYSGYNISLFLGDLNGDGKAEIMIRGILENDIGTYFLAVYTYKNNSLEEIYNHNIFNTMFKFDARYLDNYRAEVTSQDTKERYIVDLSLRPKVYLNQIYDEKGKVKENASIRVANLRGVDPIESNARDIYNLVLAKSILGVDDKDLLGVIESNVTLINNIPRITEVWILIPGSKEGMVPRDEKADKEETLNIPPDAINIPLNEISNSKVIKRDFDGDGEEELLIAYTLKGKPYVGLNKEYDDGIYFIDGFEGKGYSIKDLDVVEVNRENYILVGWRDGNTENCMDILSLKDGEINKAFRYNLPSYEKMFLEDIKGDGRKELILWTRDIDEAYNVSIYEFYKDGIRQTNKYDDIYFEKVAEYYDALLDKDEDSPIYLYHLAMAQYRTYDYIGANDTISRAAKSETKYPSSSEFNKLKSKIKKSFRK